MRIIEVITDCGHADTVQGIAEQHELDSWVVPTEDEQRCISRLLVRPDKQQAVLDSLQGVLDKVDYFRILLIPLDGALPRPSKEELEEAKRRAKTLSREELYQEISSGAEINSNFLLMVMLSTIVAAIGLLENNLAVIIGAMVIAPLLGPNIALSFATALGDRELAWSALKTNLTGLGLALVLSVLIGFFWPYSLDTAELIIRTDVDVDGIVLALASGAAAVLSLASGYSMSLVGVMVAVALLPPAATVGLMLGAGQFQNALGAGLLLAVNVVCVNLSGKLVFLFKGIKPRTWLEKRQARQSMKTYVIFWLVVLVILIIVMQVRHTYL
ncbi:MAG: TIGR00341 family protein [Gammaproteobacteria bacterium]|nr:TIGR00341 family protein [Gammaproteobacteria bacterium]